MIGTLLKDSLVNATIRKPIGCVKMINFTFQKDSRVQNAIIKRIIGCVRMSSFIFQRGLHVRNAIIRKEIGTVITVIGTLLSDFLAKNAERKLDLFFLR